jgi:hypothetical protein
MGCLQRWHDGLFGVLKNVLTHLEHMSWLHPNVMDGYFTSHAPKQTAHDDCSSSSESSSSADALASSVSSSDAALTPSVMSMGLGLFTLTVIVSDMRIHFVMKSWSFVLLKLISMDVSMSD